MSIFASENGAFRVLSCLRNHCVNLAFLSLAFSPAGCITEGARKGQATTAPAPAASAPAPAPAKPVDGPLGPPPDSPPPPASLRPDAGAEDAADAAIEAAEGDGKGAKAAADVLAEPIAPATVARFPHLAPFQGHIL